MSDTLVTLDPSEVAIERVELELHTGPIKVAPPGPDWGDAAIQAYMADLIVGSSPVDYRIPNRQIRIPLLLGADGPEGFDDARAALQSKVGLIQREGGWLKRDDTFGTAYADVVNATLTLPDAYGHLGVEADVILVLEALPDFYGDEIELDTHTQPSGTELIFVEPHVAGDHPGRVRVVVDELEGVDRLGLLYAFRCRHYSADPTAQPSYEAEELTPLDAAAIANLPIASGGHVVSHTSLATDWTPVLSTDLLSGEPMTHRGSYRVRARCYSAAAAPPQARLVWAAGDLANATENDAQTLPGTENLYTLDLGEIRIDAPAVGLNRWRGVIQAKGAADGDDIRIDKLWLQPLDEGAGKLTASIDGGIGIAPYLARDGFNQSAGDLDTLALPLGGTWATSGAATDFAVDATDHTVTIAAEQAVRYAIAGTDEFSDTVVQVDVMASAAPNGQPLGLMLRARWTDASNHLVLATGGAVPAGTPGARLSLFVNIAAGGGALGFANVPFAPNTWYTMRLAVDSAGHAWVWWFLRGSAPGSPVMVASHPALAVGGDLASGKVGFSDAANFASPPTRKYDNFAAWTPNIDAVLFGNRSAELRTDGLLRQNADGTAYGPVVPIGDLPRIPASGTEGRPVEVFLKASKGDFDQLPDPGADAIGAQVLYRPCFLFRP